MEREFVALFGNPMLSCKRDVIIAHAIEFLSLFNSRIDYCCFIFHVATVCVGFYQI